MRVGWEKELAGSWRRDPEESSWRRDSKESWRGTTDRGSQHRTPETVAEKRRSSHGEEDRLKMSAFELLVEFSLVTHASVSLHMHVVLHKSFCSLLTPSVLFVFVRLFYFLLSPRSYSCVAVKKCALPPQPLVDHRPAKKEMVRRKLTCVGWGRNVTGFSRSYFMILKLEEWEAFLFLL